MGERKGKYHFLKKYSGESIIVFEPKPKIFVWIQLRIPKQLQGENRSNLMVDVALSMLAGQHYIDFDPNIKSFARIAKNKKWEYLGQSRWFENCVAYKVNTKRRKQLPDKKEVKYLISKKAKNIISFHSQKELAKTIKYIYDDFTNE